MNTYILTNTNEIVLTESTNGIVEKTNSVDTLRVIMPKLYNETFDMSTFDVLLEYKLPISNSNGIIQMTMLDDAYKEDYVLFGLPETTMTTTLTNECGEVEFTIHCMKAELQEDGTTVERVRNSISPGVIKILPISTWLSPSEASLTALSSIYLENKKMLLALADLANSLSVTKGDDITLNISDGKVKLTANGIEIGNGIDLDTLNAELVEHGASQESGGNIKITHI